MFNEVQKLFDSAEVDEDAFTAAAAHLLNKQFVFRNHPGDQAHYQLIDRYFPQFRNALAFFGAEIIRNPESAYIGYIPKKPLSSLKLVDTFCLLTLRLIYDQEKLTGVSETKDGAIVISGDRFIDEYKRSTNRDDLGRQGSFNEHLKPLRQKSIIRFGDKNPETDVPDIIILPTIEVVIDQHYARNLIASLDNQSVADIDEMDADQEDSLHEAD